MVKVKCVQDESSHWYVIPAEKSARYRELENRMYEEGYNNMFTINEFEEEFGGYRTGGDLNNVQLYAEL